MEHNILKKALVNVRDQLQLNTGQVLDGQWQGQDIHSEYRVVNICQQRICKASRIWEDNVKSVNDQQVEQVYLMELAQRSFQPHIAHLRQECHNSKFGIFELFV